MKAELLLDAKAVLGEGPVWHEDVLHWVDIEPGVVHRYDPRRGTQSSVELGQAVGAVVPAAGGGLLAAVENGFMELPQSGANPQLLVAVEADDAATRMNDGKCDRQGRFWASTMAKDGSPGAGSLYRLTPDLRVERMLTGLGIGNGLAWSADDTLFYVIDSLAHGVDVFDFDAGEGAIVNRRRLLDVAPDDGVPDGMTIDADGCLWVALFGGGAVRRYSPQGQLEEVVLVPASAVTCCTFGGDDLSDLYITTARLTLSESELLGQPQAGGVFCVRTDATGVPVNRFG